MMPYSRKEALECLFDRPTEFIFMPKGKDNSIVFDVPNAYIRSQYRGFSKEIVKKLTKKGCKTIPIKNITVPDISMCRILGLKEQFSLFIPDHLEMAKKLIDIFMEPSSVDDLISIAAYCHDRVNPYLFNYALSVALLHREDTKEVQLPNYTEVFPAKFAPSEAFGQARQAAAVIPRDDRTPIDLNSESQTANPTEPESRLAYFREDIGINIHHWHWHLVYPTRGSTAIVNKNRRGELFYYMHQQVIARYNTERIANNLEKVRSYDNLDAVISEGYFPKLTLLVASRDWPSRAANTSLTDITRPDGPNVAKASLRTWMNRIRTDIINGSIRTSSGSQVSLSGNNGIEILGNLVEASVLSRNSTVYGNLHNLGHVLIAFCHDPDGRFREQGAVMIDTATAMRDPIFYRWHEYINSLFKLHKDRLTRYTVAQLSFPNISVTSVGVAIDNQPNNQLSTFWQQSDIDISRGLDFAPRSPVSFRYTHLQHAEFTYTVNVNNASQQQLLGTMRIFMAQKNNPNGSPLTFNEQRTMMIELDKFRVTLVPGNNVITRKSLDSSVTIPYERTFRNLDDNRPTTNPALYAFNFCGCGWPHHMLIPKGTNEGMLFDLFVMVSDYTRDEVVQDISGICNDAASYCGIQDKLYPDRQSMGYPFDRLPRDNVTTLSQFLTPNMMVQTITVKSENRTVLGAQAPVANISVITPPA